MINSVNNNNYTINGDNGTFESMLEEWSQSDADIKTALAGLNIEFIDDGELNRFVDDTLGDNTIKLNKNLLTQGNELALKNVFLQELSIEYAYKPLNSHVASSDSFFYEMLNYFMNDVFAKLTDGTGATGETSSPMINYNDVNTQQTNAQGGYSTNESNNTQGTGGTNGNVTVSEMKTSSNGEASFSGVKEGDQMVVVMTISGDLPADLNGFEVAYDKGAANGKSEMEEGEKDLRTVVLTKTATADDVKNASIDFGKKVSTQSFSVSGGKIDIRNIGEHAGDSKGQKTTIDANSNKNAAYYLNIASADDPAGYKKENIEGDNGIVSFGASVSGGDSGASWITKDNDGSSISYSKVGGGDNDQGLSIAIVAN